VKGDIERFGGTVEKFVGDAVMAGPPRVPVECVITGTAETIELILWLPVSAVRRRTLPEHLPSPLVGAGYRGS
jgi:class 3 adenylate cyclase